MKEKFLVFNILFWTFLIVFFITTAFTDMVARSNGYYQQGIDDERGVYE